MRRGEEEEGVKGGWLDLHDDEPHPHLLPHLVLHLDAGHEVLDVAALCVDDVIHARGCRPGQRPGFTVQGSGFWLGAEMICMCSFGV